MDKHFLSATSYLMRSCLTFNPSLSNYWKDCHCVIFFNSLLALIALTVKPLTPKCFCPCTQVCSSCLAEFGRKKCNRLRSFEHNHLFFISEGFIYSLAQLLSWYELSSHFNPQIGAFPQFRTIINNKTFLQTTTKKLKNPKKANNKKPPNKQKIKNLDLKSQQ